MAKLDKPAYFVVKEYGQYANDFAFIFIADWETDKNFGSRGETMRGARTTFSTGRQFSKESCSWVKCDSNEEAEALTNRLQTLTDDVDYYRKKIRESLTTIGEEINKYKIIKNGQP
jgi:hypothetical protein